MLLPNPTSWLRGRRAAATALLAAGGLAVAAPESDAGTYAAISLGAGGFNNTDGWSASEGTWNRGYVTAALSGASATGTWNVGGGRGTFYGAEHTTFKYTAPANTKLSWLQLISEIGGLNGGDWQTIVRDSSHVVFLDAPSHVGARVIEADVSGETVEAQLTCAGPNPCYAYPNAIHRITGASIVLEDADLPRFGDDTGALKSALKLVGTADVSFHASDLGSGLHRTVIYDGATPVVSAIVDPNGGHCIELDTHKYDRAVPCVLSATAGATLDTTTLDDGYHNFKVMIEDASGNAEVVWGPERKLVANHPPVNTAPPAIPTADVNAQLFSSPRIGTAMSFPSAGAWSGPNLAISVAWVRCDLHGEGCAQIPGATSLSYVPTTDDVGHTLKLASTASNAAETVTVYSARSGEVTVPKSAGDLTDKPSGQSGTTPPPPPSIVVPPALTTTTNTTNNNNTITHSIIGRVVGEPAGTACPGEKATLRFEHVQGGRMKLGYGKASVAQLVLTCTTSGKPIADAKLEIATKTGTRAAVASDVTTDGAGHATIRLAKGASRGITVGYRMYSDDALARAVATLKVLVNARISARADRKHLHNRQAVTLRGALAGGQVPKRGVTLAVQWKDGKRWRPFAQIKTNKYGRYAYAYRFTRSSRTVVYQLRVQIAGGQVDYPFVATSSKPVKVTVGR
ncbi:MAG TPA: hypothetical protein VI318_23935 [Baekduia sp.]